MSYQAYISEIIDDINSYLTSIQNDLLTTTCPTGTIDNINVSCKDYVYDGSYGNKTSTGYYVSYSINVLEIYNLFNFQLIYNGDASTTTQISDTVIYYSNNLDADWVKTLTFSGSASGSEKTYTPGYSGCVVWGPEWCKSCWKSPFGTKYCAPPYPCGWKCDAKGWIGPITLETMSYSTNYSLNINGFQTSIVLGCYISYIKPDMTVTYVINRTSTSTTVPYTYYIYQLTLDTVSFSFTGYSLEGAGITITEDEVNEILNLFFNYETNSVYKQTLDQNLINALIQINVTPQTS